MYTWLLVLTSLWTLLGVLAIARVRRRRSAAPPIAVSVLKPLCGMDPSLERNLESFFAQDHPRFELIFGVEGTDDPAIELVRELQLRHPHVSSRLVIHEGARGLNPKVRNLMAMMPEALHDLVLISDSNVFVPPGYLREMSAAMHDPEIGIATSSIVGTTGDDSLGAMLEESHLAGMVAGSIALANEAGHAAVIGKSMMFRRSVIDALGGLESVAYVLAEDYVLGRMVHAAGLRVHVCATPIENVIGRQSIRRFADRHIRWSMMRFRLAPVAYLLEPLATPLCVALLAPVFGFPLRVALMWALGLTLARDAVHAWLLRGPGHALRTLPLGPLRDLIVLAVWAIAPFRRHVTWRQTHARVSSGTRLYVSRAAHDPVDEGLTSHTIG